MNRLRTVVEFLRWWLMRRQRRLTRRVVAADDLQREWWQTGAGAERGGKL